MISSTLLTGFPHSLKLLGLQRIHGVAWMALVRYLNALKMLLSLYFAFLTVQKLVQRRDSPSL